MGLRRSRLIDRSFLVGTSILLGANGALPLASPEIDGSCGTVDYFL